MTSPPTESVAVFETRAQACLDAAKGLASFTGFPSIGSAHLAIAVLADSGGWLDPLLKELFSNLKSATVVESLVEILKTEADLEGFAAQDEPQLAEDARALLRRAESVSAEWKSEQVTIEALAFAVFEKPDKFVAEAFGDAGFKACTLESLASRLAESAETTVAQDTTAPVFQDGALNLDAFGRVTQDALGMLAKIAASEPDRSLRDIDLIYCLVSQSSSLMIEGLHVMGAPVPAIRSLLENIAGNPSVAVAASSGLKAEGMSGLLSGVIERARELALSERCLLVSESHLVRAHMNRVASSTNNVYQRLGVNTAELRNYLASHTVDRAKAVSIDQPGQRKIEDVEDYLFSHVIGQEPAIRAVLPSLRRMRAGLTRRGRVLGKFMFLGPTGVGKTELALAIADVAFGVDPKKRDACLIQLDCGNLTEERDIVQLLGAPQGLVGFKEGQLTNGLRDKPRSVILFDEAEKSNKNIWQSLLPLFDTGIVREADGTEYDATSCILIATSNKGYKEAMESFNLWEASEEQRKAAQAEVEKFVWQSVQAYFSPEFRARFGRENILFFNHFDREGYKAIVRLHTGKLVSEFLEDQGLEITVKDEVIDFLARLAWDQREEGARTVGRLIDSHIADRIATVRLADPERTNFSLYFLEGSGEVALEN